MSKQIKRLMNAKRRKGLSFYPHGIEITIPNIETGDHKKLVFRGSFDRRKLRKMVRKSLVANLTVEQIDWLIDNYGVKLRAMTNEEIDTMLHNLHEEGDDDGSAD